MRNIFRRLFTNFLIAIIPTLFCSLMASPLSYGLPLNCPDGSRVIGIECFDSAYENTTPWYRRDFGASELTFPFWLLLFGTISAWNFFSRPSAEPAKPQAARQPHRRSMPVSSPQSIESLEAAKRWLPTKCPHCGGSISTESVQWLNKFEAQCPYCASVLKA